MYKETIVDIVLGVWLGLLIGDILYRIERHFNSIEKESNDELQNNDNMGD